MAMARARHALMQAGLDPSVPLTAASSVTNEVWLTDSHVVRVNRRPNQRLRREAILGPSLPSEIGYPLVVAYGGRLGYQAERKDQNYVDAGDTANTEIAIYDYGDKTMVFETRGLSVNDSADEEINKLFKTSRGNKIGVIFYGSEGYLVQRSYSWDRKAEEYEDVLNAATSRELVGEVS